MPDVVTVTGSPDTDLAWGEAGAWLWNDPVPVWDSSNPRTVTSVVDGTVAVSEADAALTIKALSESFGFAEAHLRNISAETLRSLGFIDTQIDLIGFIMNIAENVTLGENRSSLATKPFDEDMAVAELRASSYILPIVRSLLCADALTDVVDFILKHNRSMFVLDTSNRQTVKRHPESMAVLEEYVRNAQAVFQDYIVKNKGMTLAEIKEMVGMSAPVFHERFQDLIAGDYVFQKAIVGLFVSSQQASVRPAISEFILTVDMPDVVDSGDATVTTAAKITVEFGKAFYAPPEVTCELVEGSVLSIPLVSNISRFSFDLELRTNAGALTTGEVLWTAKGR